MLKRILFVILIISIKVSGQKRSICELNLNEDIIKYSRIDFSEYGLQNIFITMYEENEKTKNIESKSILDLRNESKIYHTLYYFVALPIKYTLEEKTIIFNEIINQIKNKENIIGVNFYLNFDTDYSTLYQNQVKDNNDIKRIYLKINSKNIKKGLSIQKKVIKQYILKI